MPVQLIILAVDRAASTGRDGVSAKILVNALAVAGETGTNPQAVNESGEELGCESVSGQWRSRMSVHLWLM